MMQQKADRLRTEMQSELVRNILPFWMTKMVDQENGGFYGRIDGHGNRVKGADKGGILNARILWTFSAAYLPLRDPAYRLMAERSKNYVLTNFFDDLHGGTYWKITCDGKPLDTKKQIYSQAFFLYAFAEYYRATGDEAALEKAVSLFHLIEEKSFDQELNGYFEAYSRDWKLLEDLRLSTKDVNEKKTTNTHLHILEAYTGLFRIWKDGRLERQLKNLVEIFLDRIIHPHSHHLQLFFDEYWHSRSLLVSYGHDIEASWLIYDAAKILGDAELLKKSVTGCIALGKAALEGYQDDGSLIYETDPEKNHTDMERHWWPQAEAIVGLLNLAEMTGNPRYGELAVQCWNYIKNNLIDCKQGEWFWSIYPNGEPNLTGDKAGFWKCPYHNSRACLETIRRLEK